MMVDMGRFLRITCKVVLLGTYAALMVAVLTKSNLGIWLMATLLSEMVAISTLTRRFSTANLLKVSAVVALIFGAAAFVHL
jgi:hypothetical protein